MNSNRSHPLVAVRTVLGVWLLTFVVSSGRAQPQPPPGVAYAAGFQPGSQQLFLLDLAGTPVGEIPTNIKLLKGTLEVVMKDGTRMLKASAASEFLITLPQPLPQDFTLEFDLVPKACCAPADLGFGEVNQGVASAHFDWDSDDQVIVNGGGEYYAAPMPEDFRAALPGVLTHVGVSFQGTTVKLYTNGRRLFTLTERQFARKRELRMFLGGQDDGTNAVFLVALRIATGAPMTVAGGEAPSELTGPTLPVVKPTGGSGTNPDQTASQSQGLNGPVPTFVANVTVTQGNAGPVVTWQGPATPATYTVQRWKIDDRNCCNNASGSLSGPPWQDVPPPLSGTYLYEVTITTNGGTAKGEAQFGYQKLGGGPIPVSEPPPPRQTETSASPALPNAPLASGTEVSIGLTVTVTLGANGPVVSWPMVPNATGYGVVRSKLDDADCCNNNSGRAPLPAGPWQDQALPVSGTYLYTVNAQTPVGLVYGQAQFGYRKPEAGTGSEPLPSAPSAPIAASTGVVRTGLGVSVTLGANGPVVSWSLVPRATGYAVTRVKTDDPNCCNANSGRALLSGAPWQDQPLPMSGTYLYTVTAETPLGPLQGEAQFGYRKPESGGGGGGGIAPRLPENPQSTFVPPPNPDLPNGADRPGNSGTYRITITGFRVASETQDLNADVDGRGDEVYVATAAVVMDRQSRTIRDRVIKRSKEHGDIGNGTFFKDRIQAGTKTTSGGIWAGNGIEQIPAAFDPSGSTFPLPSNDGFPFTVWEGALTDGVEAVLVVPTIWERDVDPSPWVIWSNDWKNASLTSLFSAPAITSELKDPNLVSQISSTQPTLLPFSMAPADLLANTRDHPIGIVPQPPAPLIPVTAIYQDRYALVTREKLVALPPGGSVILPILFWEPGTNYARGRYTLYLRVERLP